MRRLLVNDQLTSIPGTRTFWHDLQGWFGCEFVGGDYATLAETADAQAEGASLIIRNATYFGPLKASERVPTISLLQDIISEGPQREMQEAVLASSTVVVSNSAFTAERYSAPIGMFQMPRGPVPPLKSWIIPLPVDFDLFEIGNAMGLQQALALPDGCVLWIGACQGAAGMVKGWDIFLQVVRANPDIPFVGVFKDQPPNYCPPNMRMFSRLTHADLVKVIGACRVGLCTSRMESQHLAGIEMGACGLPMVAPTVGTYWKREEMPGILVLDPTVEYYSAAIRAALQKPGDPETARGYWHKGFDREVIKAAWARLIEEVENEKA